MEPRIERISEKKLTGIHLTMSIANNKTRELWSRFMPLRNNIPNRLSSELLSMQVYDATFDFSFTDLNTPFEKWAVAEVSALATIPEGMESFVLPGGLYAVFKHKGAAVTGPATFQYIFGTWLPASGYAIDNRPHFEVLGEKYKNDDPDSEEEIWIPVKIRS